MHVTRSFCAWACYVNNSYIFRWAKLIIFFCYLTNIYDWLMLNSLHTFGILGYNYSIFWNMDKQVEQFNSNGENLVIKFFLNYTQTQWMENSFSSLPTGQTHALFISYSNSLTFCLTIGLKMLSTLNFNLVSSLANNLV